MVTIKNLDMAYANGKRMNVHVDHLNEPIFNWIDAEEPEETNEDEVQNYEEDKDSVFSDSCSVDHEEDDASYPFAANKTVDERFLKILCPPTPSNEDDENVLPQYIVHDDRKPWDKMKPVLDC
ncbi:unnamed protein product [Lactuca virosa]|uniref:Uncharacterized protein n=1 Tax=Lactuca virosa TaxID=75947 RepID=A0AAU9N512_9ASTR|nr:unnamed protein product [Lactuca virosa]